MLGLRNGRAECLSLRLGAVDFSLRSGLIGLDLLGLGLGAGYLLLKLLLLGVTFIGGHLFELSGGRGIDRSLDSVTSCPGLGDVRVNNILHCGRDRGDHTLSSSPDRLGGTARSPDSSLQATFKLSLLRLGLCHLHGGVDRCGARRGSRPSSRLKLSVLGVTQERLT